MPYFGLTSAFLSSPLLEKCAPYSGFGVRHAPVKVCGLLRFNCAPCSGFCTEKAGHPFSIISEMLNIHNRNLAEVAQADDFIVSDALVSLLMAQVSENKWLNAVSKDLFDPEGSEVYLKPANQYIKSGSPLNFYTVVEAARQRGKVAIGYRLHALAGDSSQAHGVVVNPDKSKMVTFSDQDRIVVLAES